MKWYDGLNLVSTHIVSQMFHKHLCNRVHRSMSSEYQLQIRVFYGNRLVFPAMVQYLLLIFGSFVYEVASDLKPVICVDLKIRSKTELDSRIL